MRFSRRHRRFRPGFLFFSILLAAISAASGEEPKSGGSDELSADRPDFTESTDTVRPGFSQLEGGLQSSSHYLSGGIVRTIGGPSPLIRVGVTSRVEVRLGTDGFQSEARVANGRVDRQTGRSDFDVSVKIRLLDERHGLPAIALIPGLSVPSGSSAFSSGTRDPFLNLCWSKELGKGFDAAGNANFRREGETAQSLSVGHKLTAGLRGFWEIYRISPIPDDERVHWIADTGVSRLLGRNFEMDLAIGHTIRARTPSWIFSIGFAVRRAWRSEIAKLADRADRG